jgi:hypothetical protein
MFALAASTVSSDAWFIVRNKRRHERELT